MSYQVTFTDSTNPAKQPLTVPDGGLNQSTSLTFVGQGYNGFAPIIANDLLHLLENFASPVTSPPTNPVEGQLWYDSTNKVAKVYDGSNWNPAGALKKAISPPESSVAGDLWVDTTKTQLYVYSGSNWILVGPQFSSGTLTGPVVDEIVDINDITHNVISFYANNYRMAVISKESFVPKAAISGFSNINEGFNLTSIDASNSTTPTRFWGTSTSADSLLINNKEIASTNFLRGDTASVANYPLSVRNDGGISIGATLAFNIGVNGSTTVLASTASGNSVDIKLNPGGGTLNTLLHLSADMRVGIGSNNTSPASTLDVAGLITTSGGLNSTDSTDSSALGTGSIVTAGGLSVGLGSNFGDTVTITTTSTASNHGALHVNRFNTNGTPITGSVILPGTDSASSMYDIGSSTRKFRNIWAENFNGTFTGSFTGSFSGSIDGSAAKLASPTTFRLAGDVTSNVITFDGQGDDPVIFNTAIGIGIISSKSSATDSVASDQMLVYRPGTSALLSMTKDVFLQHVATVPVGSIFPFAGISVPPGYLLCDGAEVEISKYPALYRAIGNTYKALILLQGSNTFGLPDYRGRTLLGRDNMNNGISVPSKTSPNVQITTVTTQADRVSDVTAKTMGAGGGSQTAALSLANLPDHKHNLNSGTVQYYAGSAAGSAADPAAVPGYGLPSSSGGSGLPNSGSVISNTPLGASFNIMNPYATVNYIIFTGVL